MTCDCLYQLTSIEIISQESHGETDNVVENEVWIYSLIGMSASLVPHMCGVDHQVQNSTRQCLADSSAKFATSKVKASTQISVHPCRLPIASLLTIGVRTVLRSLGLDHPVIELIGVKLLHVPTILCSSQDLQLRI